MTEEIGRREMRKGSEGNWSGKKCIFHEWWLVPVYICMHKHLYNYSWLTVENKSCALTTFFPHSKVLTTYVSIPPLIFFITDFKKSYFSKYAQAEKLLLGSFPLYLPISHLGHGQEGHPIPAPKLSKTAPHLPSPCCPIRVRPYSPRGPGSCGARDTETFRGRAPPPQENLYPGFHILPRASSVSAHPHRSDVRFRLLGARRSELPRSPFPPPPPTLPPLPSAASASLPRFSLRGAKIRGGCGCLYQRRQRKSPPCSAGKKCDLHQVCKHAGSCRWAPH